MKKFLGYLFITSLISIILFYAIQLFINYYDYNYVLTTFRIANKIYVIYFFIILGFLYILQQYNGNKRINIIQKSLFFVFLGILFFGILKIFTNIELKYNLIITISFLISILLVFSNKIILHTIAGIILIGNISFLAINLYPSYNKKVNIESVLAHQQNIIVIENKKNNTDDIQVSCVIVNKKNIFGVKDFNKSGYILLPLENKIKCSNNTNIEIISWDNKIYEIGSGVFKINEKRDYTNIDNSIFEITNNGKIIKSSILSGENRGILKNIYKTNFTKNAKKNFSWEFTDKENLEILEYYKLMILNKGLNNFLKYRLLIGKNIFGYANYSPKELLGNNLKDRLKFLFKKTSKKDFFQEIGRKETIKKIEEGYNGIEKTRFFKLLSN